MPLQRRVPKFGFKNINRVEYKAINVEVLQALADKNNVTTIDPEYLRSTGMLRKNDKVKILGKGKLSVKLEVKAHAFSKSAAEAIEAAQGTVVKL